MNEITTNPWLHLPLDGVHLIEASAGTGKTFTLATLVTRLVIERGWKVTEILTVTFTEAATQELRKRIRERLLLAARLVNHTLADNASHEELLTHSIVQQHLSRSEESARALARRLQVAAEDIDLAAIATIHGFCMRVLSEHALDSGSGFVRTELTTDPRALETGVAHDLWRQYSHTGATLEPLLRLWNAPKPLADSIAILGGPLPLFPPRPDMRNVVDQAPQLAASAQALASGVRQYGPQYTQQIVAAMDSGILHKGRYKIDDITGIMAGLQDLADGPSPDFTMPAITDIEKLTLEKLLAGTNKASMGKTPISPLQPLLADYLAAHARWHDWQHKRAIILLHELRERAREQMAAVKQQRQVHTHDDSIEHLARAVQGEHAQALIHALRQQYAVALVDEFQDTDARQWTIFQRVFAGGKNPALFLIGDPKQAIYGFRGGDVYTYLRAKQQAAIAPALTHNFRSRPCLLRAIETLYRNAGATAFVDTDIRFVPVAAGGVCKDTDYLLNGAPAPALSVRVIAAEKPLKADESRAAAAAACVADIARILTLSRKGQAQIDGRPVEPGDIAVLVRSHREATRMQRALALAQIPAVAAGKMSLFATDEARDIHTLLSAVRHGTDQRLLRAALASVLLGLDAQTIAALTADTLTRWQQRVLDWREHLQRGGTFALINEICAENAHRLLQLVDGERRLTNYLQLAEYLQTASATVAGLHGLLDWLEQKIATADENDETQLLRLESDARRVQIITLHKSKGLEYPLVYLPFAAIGSKGANQSNWRIIYNDRQRELHWAVDKDSPEWTRARTGAEQDKRSEEARLLYVGLTRAVHALWLAAGDFFDTQKTALAPMLGGHLDTLAAHAEIAIVRGAADPPPAPLADAEIPAPPAPRTPVRQVLADWWIYSFTQLVRNAAGNSHINIHATDDSAAADEPDANVPVPEWNETDVRFSGSRFGNVLHGALETTDFAAWGNWHHPMPAPPDEDIHLRKALRGQGYHGNDETDGLDMVTWLVGNTLTIALPEGGALATLEPDQRRAELEFHFPLESVGIARLLALLHAHGILRERGGFGNRQRLNGLMTGKIDLTYHRAGRWYVLDYKSNRLPQYDAGTLARAMQHSEYDVQALIYTLAVHRWLRFRLGVDYDYARDFGGVRYLFCRGLRARADGGMDGIVAQRFAPELIAALDALFGGQGADGKERA